MHPKLIASISILSLGIAFASETTTSLNLLEGKSSLFRTMNVYQQGSVGNCYAYTASEMFDYYRISHGEKLPTYGDYSSAMAISYDASQSTLKTLDRETFGLASSNEEPLDSGSTAVSLQKMLDQGTCTRASTSKTFAPVRENFEKQFGTSIRIENYINIIYSLKKHTERIYNAQTRAFRMNGTTLSNVPRNLLIDMSPVTRPLYVTPENKPCTQCNQTKNVAPVIKPIDFSSILEEIQKETEAKQDVLRPTIQPDDMDAMKHPILTEEEKNELMKLSLEQVTQSYADFLKVKNSPQFASWIKSIFKKVNTKDGTLELIKEVLDGCEKTKMAGAPKLVRKNTLSSSNQSIIETIDAALNLKNPQPVAIAYCGAVLGNKNTFASGKIRNFTEIFSKSCGLHQSIIVGKRVKNGKPQFLIQNTYGASCRTFYDPAWECLEGQGALWVDANDLARNTFKISYLKD